MLNWNLQRDKCLEIIKNNKSKFKIFLKIKNETKMLSDWIKWHSDICGERSLFIFDNLSVNNETFEIYKRHPDLNVFSYTGFHNDLHRPSCVEGLYETIRESTNNYIFLDSDERLACLQDNYSGLVSKKMILEIVSQDGYITHPTVWIDNFTGMDNIFILDKNLDHFKTGLKLGKPLINSKEPLSQMMNHNFQLEGGIINKVKNYRFIVFHLKNFDAMQRINTNINKLIAYNAFKDIFTGSIPTLVDILKMDPYVFPIGNKRNWIMEIQKAALRIDAKECMHDKLLGEWRFQINLNDNLTFGSLELGKYFKDSFSGCINK
jgi:hypothetical protein